MLTDKELEEIRRKMLELEEEPPAGSWKNIQAEVQPPSPNQNWRPLGWFGIILLLLLATVGALQLMQDKPVKDIIVLPEDTLQNSQAPATGGERHTGSKGKVTEVPPVGSTAVAPLTPSEGVSGNEGSTASENPVDASELAVEPSAQADATNRNDTFTTRESTRKEADLILPIVIRDTEARGDNTAESKTIGATALPEEEGANMLPPSVVVISSVKPILISKEAFALPDSVGTVPYAQKSEVTATAAEDRKEKKEKKIKEPKEWYLGVNFASRYAFRSFKPTATDDILITNVDERKKLDPERMGYEFGMSMGRMIKENLYLETSLSLMQLRENVSYSYTDGTVDTLVRSMSSDGTVLLQPVYKLGERELKSSFAYGGLRVGLTYFFMERAQSRFNITVAGGVNLLVKGRTKEYINGEWIETVVFPSRENLLEQSNYNLLIGAGYNISFHDKYELMLMPSLNYFLGSTFKEREPFGLRPYTLGVSVQVRRRFNR